jgi:hypothetical protein
MRILGLILSAKDYKNPLLLFLGGNLFPNEESDGYQKANNHPNSNTKGGEIKC